MSPGTGKTVAQVGVHEVQNKDGTGSLCDGNGTVRGRTSRMEDKEYLSRNIKSVSVHGSRF